MNINSLRPPPQESAPFRRDSLNRVPDEAGCYALVTFSGTVLYVGLAINLRRRMSEHLDNPQKRNETKLGRAILFFWLKSNDLNLIERSWLNLHEIEEGDLPIFNRLRSPTYT